MGRSGRREGLTCVMGHHQPFGQQRLRPGESRVPTAIALTKVSRLLEMALLSPVAV